MTVETAGGADSGLLRLHRKLNSKGEMKMAQSNTDSMHAVWARQLEALAARDIDKLMENYNDDAVLVRFDTTAVGIDAVRKELEGYLAMNPEVIELKEYTESDDVIFYRATMRLGGQVENGYGTLVLRNGLIWRQTAGWEG
jgi:ketosteroid isomerase-like protein